MKTFRDHVDRAVKALGSQAKLAQEVGCSQQQISLLLTTAKGITAEMAIKIDLATKGLVSKHDLRPDIFGERRESAA